MPWTVREDDRCPANKPWGVIKKTDDSLEGCHPSKEAGLKQAAALYASEPRSEPMNEPLLRRDFTTELHVRAEPEGAPPERIIEGIVVPFGVVADVVDRTADGGWGRPYKESIVKGATEGLDPSRVTLESTEHEGKLVGRGLTATATEEGLHMALRVAKTPAGDELLELAREGVLTGMSAVFKPISDRRTYAGVVERTAIDIRRVAVLERGAYESAQVTAVRAAPDPPPEVAAPTKTDPPKGGSSDSRSKTVTEAIEYLTREDKAARVTELEEIISRRATAYPGVLPDPEQLQDDADNKERDDHLRDIQAWDRRQARLAEFASRAPADERNLERAAPAPYQPPVVNQINRMAVEDIFDVEGIKSRAMAPSKRDLLFRDNAMRATEIFTFPHPATDVPKTRDRIANILDNFDSPDKEFAQRVLVTGSPIYRRAFNKLVMHQPLSPEEQRGTALAVGVDATGGFAIPVVFDLSVIAIGSPTGAINPYRRVCRVVPIVGTDTWNALTATAVTATRTTEAAPAIEQGPTFAQPQYIVKRVQAQITYSMEVAQDRTDIASEMAVLIQEAKDNEEENQFAVGVGTTVFPLGVGPVNGTSGAYTSLTTSTSVTLLAADVDLVEAALPVRHRFNAQWFLNRSSIRRLQTLEILGGKLFGGNGYYPAVGNPDAENTGNTGLRLIGYPVNESPSLPTATTANIVIGTLLNPDSYVIVDRIGMSVQIIPFIFGASQGNLVTGQQALYAMWRNDARPINVDAGRTLRYLT